MLPCTGTMTDRHPLTACTLLAVAAACVAVAAVATAAVAVPRVSVAAATAADAVGDRTDGAANVAAAATKAYKRYPRPRGGGGSAVPAAAVAAAAATTTAAAAAAATPAATPAAAAAASAAATAATPAPADAAAVAACVAASRTYVRAWIRSFGGEAGANAFKVALRRRAAALAATDGSGPGPPAAGDGFWWAPSPPRSNAGGGGDDARAVPAPPLVVDVGANTGQGFSSWRAAFPGATIVAVEANPVAAARLAAVPAAGGRTHVLHAAVGTGGAAVYRMPIHGSDGQLGGLWVGATRPHPEKYRYKTVPTLPLDVLLSPPHTPASVRPPTTRTYPISLLKTDAEGWDVAILRGAPATLGAARFLLFECSNLMALPPSRGGPASTHAEAAATLAAAGFETYLLGRTAAVRFDPPFGDAGFDTPPLMGWHNCVAVRRGEPLRGELLRELGVLPECVGAYGVGE